MICLPKKRLNSLTGCLLAMVLASASISCNKMELGTPDSNSNALLVTNRINSATALSPAAQTARTGVIVSEHIHGFYEYLPKAYYNDSKKYPLLICLHGIGQVGNGTSDLPSLLSYGPAMLINNGTFPSAFSVDGQSFSMMVITPQFTEGGIFPLDIDALIEYCKTNYKVDTNRIYLAGLSIGGANLWHYAGYSAATAAKITAMVPICSWTTPELGYQVTQQEAQTIAAANIKIWQTHCYNDPTASFSWSVSQANMVCSSNPLPDPRPKLTAFNSDSHDAWTTTYDPKYKESAMNIYQWMLHYSKGTTSTPIPQKPPISQVVTLKGSNNLYVHNNGDGSPLYVNSTSYTLWEGFVVVAVTGNKVALKNQNRYITKVNPGSVSCTATSITGAETFLWVFNSDGSVSFQGNNSKYLSNNNGLINCKAVAIGPNEKFWINH